MKNSRAELLEHVFARLTRPRDWVRSELKAYGWDSEIDHYTLTADDIVNVISLAIAGSITVEELVDWAEFFDGQTRTPDWRTKRRASFPR